MEDKHMGEISVDFEEISPTKSTKMKSDKKPRKQTRFSIASSPLGTITNLVLPTDSPVKTEVQKNSSSLASTPQEGEMDGVIEDENEVFFGNMSDYEKRKASKLRRRTVVFTPSFRAHLVKTPSKGSSRSSTLSDDREGSLDYENQYPVDVTVDSVFGGQDDSSMLSSSHSMKPTSQSTFYSVSGSMEEDLQEDGQERNTSIYHAAMEVPTPVTEMHNEPKQSDSSEIDDTVDTQENTLGDKMQITRTIVQQASFRDSPAKQHLAANKIQGWFRMTKQKKSYNKAFKNMSSLKDKTNKFLEELRMEQRSRGNTPTNSPLPSKRVKKSDDESIMTPPALRFKDSSDDSSQDDDEMTEIDGFPEDLSYSHIGSSYSHTSAAGDILQETAQRLQSLSKGSFTPVKGNSISRNYCGTPQSIHRMEQNVHYSPMVFSSPKVYPVTVQTQQSRNPLCSVTFSPRTPMCSVTFSPRTPSYQPTNEFTFSPNVINQYHHTSSPLVVKPTAFKPLGTGSAIKVIPSAFTSVGSPLKEASSSNVGSSLTPLARSTFKPLELGKAEEDHSLHMSPFQQVATNQINTPNKENTLECVDSPNITTTRRSRKRGAVKERSSSPVQVVQPLPVKSQANTFQSMPTYTMSVEGSSDQGVVYSRNNLQHAAQNMMISSANVMMSSGSVSAGEQESMPSAVHHQMSQLSLIQQKQQELERIKSERRMLQEKIKEDNNKCFHMRHEIADALRSNMSPEGLPQMDSHVVILGTVSASSLTLNAQELDVVTRLHTIRNSQKQEQMYKSPVAHDRHQTGRVRLQWHHDLVTPVDQLNSPHLHRRHAPDTTYSILAKK